AAPIRETSNAWTFLLVESLNSTMCLISLGGLGRSLRIPLSAPHARDLHRLEQTGFAKRLIGGEFLRRVAATHVDDEHAARPRLAVLGERPAGEHNDALVALEVREMRLARRLADRLAVASVFVDHDVEHPSSLESVPSRHLLGAHPLIELLGRDVAQRERCGLERGALLVRLLRDLRRLVVAD